jgi:Putative peptidoglycan binding domain/Caspase domain
MPHASRRGIALVACFATLASPALADADPPSHVALVIGNANYGGLPPLPQCAASAHVVADVLQRDGFDVADARDATNGQIGGRVAALRDRLHRPGQADLATMAPSGAAVIYVCGYAQAFDGRSYVLPTGSRVERPADLLAEGVAVRALARAPAAVKAARSLVLLDLVPVPGTTSLPGLDALAPDSADTHGVVAAVEAAPVGATPGQPAATSLATAAASALAAPQPEARAVIAAIRDAFGSPVSALTIDAPAKATPLYEPETVQALAPLPPPIAVPVRSEPAAGPPVDLTTEAGRRQIQSALQRLGYYPGQIDGVVGPGTKAAIRRLQFELRHDLTGRLTPDEVTQLLARAR